MRLIELTQIDHHISKKVREFRIKKGVSLSELGELAGLSFQQIQKYEKGLNRISASKLFEIAIALNKPVSVFFDDFKFKNGKYYIRNIKNEKTRQKETDKSNKALLPLIRSFNMIENRNLKKHLIHLVKEISGPFYRKKTKHEYS